MNDTPPKKFYFRMEVIRDDEGSEPRVTVGPPYANRQYPENDVEGNREALEQVEVEHGEQVYAEYHQSVHELHLTDRRWEKAERQNEESHRITMETVGAVGASLLAEDGIGPLADSSNGGKDDG